MTGVRVLVVEDNPDVGSFVTDSLAELGCTSVLTSNGNEALAALEEKPNRFDVVFSDVVMPGMNGVELGQEIRRRYDALPVVLASGYSHVLAEGGAGEFELLSKPYSIDQLAEVLRRVMGVRAKSGAGAQLP
jgi:DNA-binding NtrC family response regulator